MKPFDLEKALVGAKVVTRDGDEVTGLHLFEAGNNPEPLYGMVKGIICSFSRRGEYYEEGDPAGRTSSWPRTAPRSGPSLSP